MWQRKQSVLLAMGALLAFASWLFPIASYTGDLGEYKLRTYGLFLPDGTESTMVSPMLPFEVLHSVLGFGMLVAILLYGNRPRQARVVRGLWMLQLPVIAFQYITMNSTLAYLARQGTIDQSMGFTFFLPMVVLVLVFIAERMIRSDEALVRSAERLR
jgi:hypothetical protein